MPTREVSDWAQAAFHSPDQRVAEGTTERTVGRALEKHRLEARPGIIAEHRARRSDTCATKQEEAAGADRWTKPLLFEPLEDSLVS